MIFVTVGTHEQPFDRLIKCIDDLKADGTLTEDVIIQTGFSTYTPKHCKWQKLFPYQKMVQLVNEARIVVTHGGPSSFIMPIQINKVPIVVPRMQRFREHVNDHQVIFCREVAIRNGNIILVEDISVLRDALTRYNALAAKRFTGTVSNNDAFNKGIQQIVDGLFQKV